MSLTDRILPRYILSRVRVSVRPSNLLYTRTTHLTIVNRPTVSPALCLFQWVADRSLSCQRRKGGTQPWLIRHGWPHRHSDDRGWGVRVRECEHVWACMHACVRDVFAIYEHNILPRLKMIIIKIVILYFIQIRHTDDFPSTGARLVI